MNNYRKYCGQFEKRRFETTIYKPINTLEYCKTFFEYDYNKLIRLVSKHTGINSKDITWEICARWLLEEVKEPIKLTKFEFDLIETNDQPKSRLFSSFSTYRNMMERGYFKSMKGNEDKSLQWILDNCEVHENE